MDDRILFDCFNRPFRIENTVFIKPLGKGKTDKKLLPIDFLKDKKLTNAEKGILAQLYAFENEAEICLTDKEIMKAVEKFKELGYLELLEK